MSAHLDFAMRLADDTGVLLKGYFKDPGLERKIKSDRSLVTEADLASDRFIWDAIRKQYPDDLILSEERRTVIPREVDQTLWLVDPLDGTTNFSLGIAIWGILITRIVDGNPTTAVAYFPMIQEMYTAEAGVGVYLNGSDLEIQPPSTQNTSPFFNCCSRTLRRYRVDVPYKLRIFGSAAYSFCALVKGAAIVSFEATPKIWDIAGPWLMAREAGGVIGVIQGNEPFPIQAGIDYASHSFPTLGAVNRDVWVKTKGQIHPI